MKPGRETKKRESSRREKPWKKTLRERLLNRVRWRKVSTLGR